MTSQKFDHIVYQLAPQFKLVRSWPLIGGSSAQMTALEITSANGETKKLIVRQPGTDTLKENRNPHAARDEFNLLHVLHAAGLPTAKPLIVDESCSLLPTPYLVMEYIEGAAEFSPANISDFVEQAATALAQIHKLDCTKLDLAFLPIQTRSILERFGQRPSDPDTSSIEWRIWDVLESVGTIPQANPPTLVHGDFWPGNLLWRDGRLAAVIDWEDAVLGDPLSDFAISRLDHLMIFGQDALQKFTQAYQSAMPQLDFTYLPCWDLCAALRAAQNLTIWGSGFASLGRPDITEQTMSDHHGLFTAQALEMLSSLDRSR